ncbi:hypothetical protein [Celerinatantimonas yamalensis]|uniref:Uncharacterized protein n=1 Tax=Celerinatantimonas yamalensis TaxID=559956 RepID=A0ABW9G4W1_9GAMM
MQSNRSDMQQVAQLLQHRTIEAKISVALLLSDCTHGHTLMETHQTLCQFRCVFLLHQGRAQAM